MHDPLRRLHNLKLALAAVSISFVGFALMVFDRWLSTQPQFHDLAFFPWGDIGATLFTAGMLGIGIDFLLRRDDEERAEERLQRVLRNQAPALRAAVIDGFAFNAEDLAVVATPDTLDRVMRNSLALRLDDPEFASEIYDDLRDKAIRASERWHDAKVSVHLTTASGETEAHAPAYIATMKWEYTVVPKHPVRRFAAVSDRNEYRDLMADSEATTPWYVRPASGIDAGDRETFELVQFVVDGDPRMVRRTARRGGQVYTASIGDEAVLTGKPVAVSYTCRALIPKHGHLLHLDMDAPTRNISVELDYTDTDLDYVNVLDFFVSSHKTRIEHTPTNVPERSVTVAHDGWVFQRSGVAFVLVSHGSDVVGESADA
ncbi:hypothetical protein [Nocardia aurea]|uniref:hypothetical protein n=1 Tax=Nocardia aurea TaxID=2144174 RepID=UPI000D695D10|nr:hypothetical protein [Nocardia aurea]